MKVLLGNGYFVEIDSMNHTLKQKYIGKNKKGEEQEYEKTHGYFSNLESAIERYLFLNQIDSMADLSVDMKEYLELVRVANENAVKAFEALMECGREYSMPGQKEAMKRVEMMLGVENKQTNADRIRSMTDEELAEFLKGIDNGHEIVMGYYFYTKKYAVMMSSDKVLEWLQKDSEV